MPVAFDGLCFSVILLVAGVIGWPIFIRRRWPRDWENWAVPAVVLWIIGSVAFFFLYEWVMGRA